MRRSFVQVKRAGLVLRRRIWSGPGSPSKIVGISLGIGRDRCKRGLHRIKASSNLGPSDNVIIYDNGDVADLAHGKTSETFTTRHNASRPTETFASIRFAGESLSPLAVSSFMGLRPTVAYAKGDGFVAGERKIAQKRTFGLWLFSTENLIFSSQLGEHELALYLCLLAPTMKHATSLRSFLEREHLTLTISFYWYGSVGSEMPIISSVFDDFLQEAGGVIETDFEIEEADDHAA